MIQAMGKGKRGGAEACCCWWIWYSVSSRERKVRLRTEEVSSVVGGEQS